LRQFDYLGALLAMIGLGCIVAGLTQGSPAGWQPYTYILIIAGAATLAAFTLAERQATRPLVPMQLFSVPNFPAGRCYSRTQRRSVLTLQCTVILAYFLAYGAFSVWQFYSASRATAPQRSAEACSSARVLPQRAKGGAAHRRPVSHAQRHRRPAVHFRHR